MRVGLLRKLLNTEDVIDRTLSAAVDGNERPPVLVRKACSNEQCPRATFGGLHKGEYGVFSKADVCREMEKKVLHDEFQNESGHARRSDSEYQPMVGIQE